MAELPPDPRLMRLRAVAAYLDVSPSTVRRMLEAGKLPPPIKLSEGVSRWDRAKLDAFLDRASRKAGYDDPDEALDREDDHGRQAARR